MSSDAPDTNSGIDPTALQAAIEYLTSQARWPHASAAFKAEQPWCGWTIAFAHGSDWDTTCFGLERLVGINILLTTADGRSRPVNMVNWQYIDSQYDSNGECERKAGIEVVELDTEHYEPIDPNKREQVPYEDIREIVVF